MPEAIEPELVPGAVVWAQLSPHRAREQAGLRPVVVVSGRGYLDAVTTLVIGVPLTTVGRGWPNHVQVGGTTGLERPSWAMTEQPRTLSRTRLGDVVGSVNNHSLAAIRGWLADFLA